jgi:cytochrome P450
MPSAEARTEADEILDRLLNEPEGKADPYPLYRRLHEIAPFHQSTLDGKWYVTRYDTCQQVLLDSRFGHSQERLFRRPGGMTPEQDQRFEERMAKRRRRLSMLTENPPEHTRLRRLVSKAFTFRRVEGLRPRVAELAAGYLDRMAEERETDVMTALAFPLSVNVIGELVGVPRGQWARFRRIVQEGLLAADRPDPTEEEIQRAEHAFEEMEAVFVELVEARRAELRDDLISALIAVRDEEDSQLSEEDMVSTAFLLFLAGSVGTTDLVGNGLLALFRHPGELARLWNDASLVTPAVEEMLRYDSPAQLVRREALEPAEVEGHELATGETIIPLIGAANRDPRRFPDPDRFDIGRTDNHPLSLGWGIHHCLGAPLARAQGQIVFGMLRERFSSLDLLDPAPQLASSLLRGLRSLRIRCTPR